MDITYDDFTVPKMPTADEARMAVQELFADLEMQHGDADRIFCYVVLAGYIIKSDEAQRFLQACPELGAKLRTYTDEYLRTNPELCGILFDVSAMLTRLGF
jgi:hypothetical protein